MVPQVYHVKEDTMEDKIVRAMRSEEKQRLALQMRREMTPAEERLWQRLWRSQLLGLHFRRQQVIEGLIADFHCREARLVIECDGSAHQSQGQYDQERDRILAAQNLEVLRFTNDQVEQNLSSVLEQIARAARIRLASKYQA